jgi:hypothetical protein
MLKENPMSLPLGSHLSGVCHLRLLMLRDE